MPTSVLTVAKGMLAKLREASADAELTAVLAALTVLALRDEALRGVLRELRAFSIVTTHLAQRHGNSKCVVSAALDAILMLAMDLPEGKPAVGRWR